MAKGDFITYIVSDNPNAYPDGGEQGGYWYEKVVDGIPLPSGLTKFAVDKFTPASKVQSLSIPHSLLERPRIAIIVPNDQTPTSSGYLCLYATTITDSSAGYISVVYIASNGLQSAEYKSISTVDESSITYNSANAYLAAGVEYTLITMA